MEKNVALEIVLSEVCCNNGYELCDICPLKGKECGEIVYSIDELIEAIKTLSNL